MDMGDDDERYLLALLEILPWCSKLASQEVTFKDGSTPAPKDCGANAIAMVSDNPHLGIQHGWLITRAHTGKFHCVGHMVNTGLNNSIGEDGPSDHIGQFLNVTPIHESHSIIAFIPDVQAISIWNERKNRLDAVELPYAVQDKISKQLEIAIAVIKDGSLIR